MSPTAEQIKFVLAFGLATLLGVLGWIGWTSFTERYREEGRAEIQALWDAQKENDRRAREEVQGKLAAAEQNHRQKVEELTDALSESEKRHQAELAAARLSYERQLQLSATRADIYHRQAQGNAAEQARLASHAARLDRAVTEGIEVVQGLTATLRQRDESLILLGKQIQADRELLEEIPDGK